MSDVAKWRLYAFMSGDHSCLNDESRNLAEWQVQDAIRWCMTRGFDSIYLDRDPQKTASFTRQPAPAGVRHFYSTVKDDPGLSRLRHSRYSRDNVGDGEQGQADREGPVA